MDHRRSGHFEEDPSRKVAGAFNSVGNQGVVRKTSPDGEMWQQQRGLIPLHKAKNKYEVGEVIDEEHAKQRQVRAILNKLNCQNFGKLFKQVKTVNIDSAVTLAGVTSQIFEKALMEPTYCEIYANFCVLLNDELPDFNEDNEKVTLKRLLINKCQEEFERGEREQEEANKDDEGEDKLTNEEREEKRVKAIRRMLGNIRLIAKLYKKKMLTERTMHECIKKLLGSYQDPDEEDIEALCTLMSTIGEMIDHPKAKERMDAYFERMKLLSNNMNLSSRVRFMLRDAIDLRKNKWQQKCRLMQKNSPNGVTWQQQRGLIPQLVIHKAIKYKVGKMIAEEHAKQRQVKAILNKQTRQNFGKLFEQVKAVNIDNAVTLTGLTCQIFEKALMEPTYCEIYANFCALLNARLPAFSGDNKEITFKRLLLNMCQEEFERGEREQEEANKDDEGEVMLTNQEREEKRVKAIRRMLGNIRLIGELCKIGMLPEKVVHACIQKLLRSSQDPDEEDIEALCMLMSTIGEMIDHPKAKKCMDAYFERMKLLSNNMNLSSRVRFMLRDAIDLRKNKWQQKYRLMQKNSPDGEMWQQQRGLIPLHKAENKYEVGKMIDEEHAKQRQVRAILNKRTRQNFGKLFNQVKTVNIDSVVTLTGVTCQIFEKALMEPTYCEIYANFCLHLSAELPDFNEGNEKITFKRLLLNKLQMEFERGEREQEEANKDDESEFKLSNEEREEKRVKARRRKLGNIGLIGELYKKKMLTERIMHECIKKLLGSCQDPDEEDIEALCKLMSTIGEMIDHPRAKEHMDAYFERMKLLSNNMNLSSRVRFMLRDAIDLRKNKWQQKCRPE